MFRGLSSGEPRLGLPALSGIFATNQCPTLDGTKLENRSLLFAVFKLAWLREGGSLARVNWRDMGPEELGSVYESLLELVPQITADGRQFAFATGGETKGNARKTTGSYYTPDNLVQILLDNALEPIIADTLAKNPGNAVEALLSLSIVDPACGSGHFLLAAARRLAAHVARIQANGTPSTTEYKHALRQVVGRCIFGVDLNPMAVELCKVALWMEAVEPGTPLTFLNSHIRHGNALLGTTPDLMSRGIPDAAWAPIAGDDKKIASALKKRNREEAGGQRTLDFGERRHSEIESEAVMRAFVALDASSDTKFEELTKKEERWGAILDSPEYRHQKFVADAWCASFVWPKQPGELADAAPTNEMWRQIRDGQERVSELTENTVAELTEQYQFFHWHLQFPQVFAKGGFDVVLGNPPWDKIQIEEQHFFASTHPEIATADARRRKRLIENLAEEEPTAFARYRLALTTTLGTVQLVKAAGSYPLTGKGNVATHALFAELAHSLLASRPECSLALVVPSGLATQDSQKELFAFLIDGRLRLLFDFENSGGLFAEVHRSFRFALVVATAVSNAAPARFSFFLKEPSELHESGRVLYIDSSYLQEISPNTRSAPLARTQRDLDILIRICRAGVALRHDEGPSPWGWQSSQMFNETHEADDLVAPSVRLENQGAQLSRLYEAKLLHQFDHRFSTYDDNQTTRYVTAAEHNNPSFLAQTRWFVPSQIWSDRVTARNFGREWVIAFRRIARATDERTFIATVLPRCGTGSQTPIGTVSADAVSAALLLGNLNSFVFDFGVRLRSGGTDLNHFIVNQLFVVSPDRYNEERWRGTAELLKRIVLELTYTAWDLAAFAQDIGYEGPPFRWDLERRFFLRCELDAAFFSLYGLSRDDASYIMDSFPIVYRSDEKAYGYYRTKHVILEIYDAMAEAVRIGNPYQTRLNPPPADPLAAHHADVRGNVVQFGTQSVSQSPMAPGREILAWGPELISLVAVRVGTHATTGRWGTTWQGLDLGMHALAAVLRNLPGPTSREEVERAVVLTILPRLLQSKFDAAAAAAWGHAIGAANMGIKSIASLQIKWDEVLRRAVIEHVLNVDANGEWCAGPDVGDVPSAELDARAIVSLSWLSYAIWGGDDIELISQTEALRVA